MIKHIFCDLDGTLYHNGISEDDANAIGEIEKKGVKFHIATGRIFNQAYKMTKDKISMNGYYICENGSFIHDSNKEKIFKGTIDDNLVKKVASRFESKTAHIYFKYDGKVVLTGGEDTFKRYTSEFTLDPDFTNRDSFNNLVGNIGIVSGDIEELNRIELYLKSEFSENLDIYFSASHTLNIVPRGVSKRRAIEYVCNILDADMDEVATIGDSPNDICMLEGMKYSFAMENARDSVKESANYTASSVKEVLENIKKINKNRL
ncbi:MAG: HAD family hydrolase [Romboutsia sp.]